GLIPAYVNPGRFLPSYLVAYLFWVGIALGCISLTLLHHLAGGTWGLVLRRPMEAGALTLLPLAVLFLPLALGLPALYPWARWTPEFIRTHEAIRSKAHYLNTGFFLGRTAGYFVVWFVLAYLLNRWSTQEDRAEDRRPTDRLQTLGGPGLGIVFLTATFASIDWMMTLEPDWYSTLYGAMTIVGWGLLTFAAMTLIVAFLAEDEPMAGVATPQVFHDLGNLMLAFVMLWAYLAFSHFLIIWSGNLTEEIPWYLRRTRGGWQYVVLALMVFHFFLPFCFLLFRENKRRARTLVIGAGLIIAMHLVNLTWLIIPARFDRLDARPYLPWLELVLIPVAALGIGGIWLAFFLRQLKARPLVPRHADLEPASDHAAHRAAQPAGGL
ncbi:MAG TPA: hypothetical protein VF590_00630, partial [Isosphaeraceae bacterium]